ncbi:hypothetical protein ACQ4PT_046767 [Festuca glaucescens]
MMPSATCDGGATDHISELSDDLLLHVLSFLSHNARDVVRTSALSTRWRSLWTRAPVLRLMNKAGGTDADDVRFNDFVHSVLGRRAYCGADVDMLDLHAWLWPGKSRAGVWLRRAMRHTVGSLEFELYTPPLTVKRMTMPEYLADRLRPRLDLPTTTRVTKMFSRA